MEKPITEAGILEAYLIPWSRRLLKIPYLKALRETFCIMMPLIIMLALLNMAGSLVLNPLGPVMSDEGLGLGTFLSGGLHGQTYRDSNFFQLMMNFADFINVISFLYYLAFSIIFTGQLSRIWRTDKMLSILCTLTGYVFLLAISTMAWIASPCTSRAAASSSPCSFPPSPCFPSATSAA